MPRRLYSAVHRLYISSISTLYRLYIVCTSARYIGAKLGSVPCRSDARLSAVATFIHGQCCGRNQNTNIIPSCASAHLHTHPRKRKRKCNIAQRKCNATPRKPKHKPKHERKHKCNTLWPGLEPLDGCVAPQCWMDVWRHNAGWVCGATNANAMAISLGP